MAADDAKPRPGAPMSSLARTHDEQGIELHLPVAAVVIPSAYLSSPARGGTAPVPQRRFADA
jgi:hypothetical protein